MANRGRPDATPGDEKIRIHIDPDLKELIPGYLENRRKDIREILRSLDQENMRPIQLLGHSMKGSGGGYGFDFISEIGRAIEAAAKEKSGKNIKGYITKLENFLDRVEVVFD